MPRSAHAGFPVAMGILLVHVSILLAQGEAVRSSPPSEAAQKQALQLAKDVFGDDYRNARTADQKKALARTLFEKARESKGDPASHFVLLRLARDIAASGGETDLAFRAIDEMAAVYKIAAVAMKAEVLTKCSEKAQTVAQHEAMARLALALMTAAAADEDFPLAGELGELAKAQARSARDTELARQAGSRMKEIDKLAKVYEDIEKFTAILKEKPADPEANLTVGKYRCLVKGDWDAGLPLLARGNDAALKALAFKELERASDVADQVQLGDGWWEQAQQADEPMRRPLQERAEYWYRKASPNATGLSKAKMEKRLAKIRDSQTIGPKPSTKKLTSFLDSRREPAKEQLLTTGGGDSASEAAVERALKWLARHQNRDGSWSLGHSAMCKDATCTGSVGSASRPHGGSTAMGLLPFLAAGQTHLSKGPNQRTVLNGLQWLLKIQKQNGDLSANGPQMYCHGLASIALCEAVGLTRDSRVRAAAQNAIAFIESGQNTQGAWRYSHGCADSDTSVFGWQMMALRTGMMAGLTVNRQKFEAGRTWLALVSGANDAENGRPPETSGRFGYAGRGSTPPMTAIGLLITQYLGAPRDDPAFVGGVQYLMQSLPGPDRKNLYYWYYATQVLHNRRGPDWDRWNEAMRRILLQSQCSNGCATGSWDPEGDQWGSSGGRLMETSFATLTLQVYYRYPPLYEP